MRERIKWVDTAKGIAIILVVVGHVVQSYHNVNQYTDSTLFNLSGQFVYSFHMALFMMLSGMLFTMSYRGVANGMGEAVRKLRPEPAFTQAIGPKS